MELDRPDHKYDEDNFYQSLLKPWDGMGRVRRSIQEMYNKADGEGEVALRLSDGTTLKAHKFVLCLHSDWFKAALHGPFQEATTKTIDLSTSNIPTRAIRNLVKMLYLFDQCDALRDVPSLIGMAELFWAADYFGVKVLRDMCEEQWNGCFENRHMLYDEPLLPVMQLLYNDAPDTCRCLRGELLRTTVYASLFLHQEQGPGNLKETLYAVPEFAADLSMEFSKFRWEDNERRIKNVEERERQNKKAKRTHDGQAGPQN